MRIIKLSRKHKRIAEGCYGVYYRLTARKGIKVFHYMDYSPKSLSECLESVKSEVKALRKAYKTGVTPKFYELVFVKRRHGYSAGIIMEHIPGKMLYECENVDTSTIARKIEAKLAKFGFHHGDLHYGNIIYNPRTKKAKACDLGFLS